MHIRTYVIAAIGVQSICLMNMTSESADRISTRHGGWSISSCNKFWTRLEYHKSKENALKKRTRTNYSLRYLHGRQRFPSHYPPLPSQPSWSDRPRSGFRESSLWFPVWSPLIVRRCPQWRAETWALGATHRKMTPVTLRFGRRDSRLWAVSEMIVYLHSVRNSVAAWYYEEANTDARRSKLHAKLLYKTQKAAHRQGKSNWMRCILCVEVHRQGDKHWYWQRQHHQVGWDFI